VRHGCSSMIQRLRFEGVTGEPLAAVFHPPKPTDPDAGVRGSLLVVHCFTCSKDLNTMSRLARGLAGAGFAVLRFDFTGLGESGGDFSATTLSTNLGDLARAVACLQERGTGPVGLVGHSLGGAACLLAAGELAPVRSVAVIAGPSTAGHVVASSRGWRPRWTRPAAHGWGSAADPSRSRPSSSMTLSAMRWSAAPPSWAGRCWWSTGRRHGGGRDRG